MEHQAQGAAVSGRNRSKLKNFESQNRQYQREVMFDNAEWNNEVQLQDIEQDQVYQSMIQQWSEQDQQLDKIFAKADQNVEKAIVEMYENDYAGTGTGRTAARLAGKSAKKLGQFKSNQLHSLMMAKEDAALNKERIQLDAAGKSRNLYEKIRFAPIHGPTPEAPELEAKPGMGGLILGIAGAAAKSWLGPDSISGKTKADLGDATPANIAGPWDQGPTGSSAFPTDTGGLNIAGIQEYSTNPNSNIFSSAYDDASSSTLTWSQDQAWLGKIR